MSAAALALSGCGGAPEVKLPPTAPFSGTVKLDNEPLAGANITFMPASTAEFLATGTTDDSGKYELQTVGSKLVKGAVPGKYKVRINVIRTPDGKPVDLSKKGAMPGRETLKPEYADAALTKLTATIPADGGTQDFDLKSK